MDSSADMPILSRLKPEELVLGDKKLFCWSTGPANPTLSKNKKVILQNAGQLAIFLKSIFCCLKKLRNKT